MLQCLSVVLMSEIGPRMNTIADPNDKEFAKEGRPALTGDELINAPGLSFQFLRKASAHAGGNVLAACPSVMRCRWPSVAAASGCCPARLPTVRHHARCAHR